MTDIIDVLEALRDRLRTIDGLNAGIALTGNVTPPYAFTGLPAVPSYRQSFAGTKMTINPTITLLTSSLFDEIGVRTLAEFMAPTGPKSIYGAIMRDPKLGGVVEACRVMEFRPLGAEDHGAIGYYGGVFELEIMASGVGV